ncbi:hypothetical protein [Nocardia asteroides]|uniref:hypothetical protein n=1 Tax=Nocardia asteroides TaxID=1824 RepID=UPI0033D5AB69
MNLPDAFAVVGDEAYEFQQLGQDLILYGPPTAALDLVNPAYRAWVERSEADADEYPEPFDE